MEYLEGKKYENVTDIVKDVLRNKHVYFNGKLLNSGWIQNWSIRTIKTKIHLMSKANKIK